MGRAYDNGPPAMRILIVTPRLPWPPTDGGRIAMGRLAQSLSHAGATVEILSLNPRKHRGEPAGPLPITAVDIDTSRKGMPILRALTTGTPYIIGRFVSRELGRALVEMLKRFDPDIVQIESPFILPYAPLVRRHSRARISLRSLNVEFRIWEGLERIEPQPLRRLALRRVARSLASYEVRVMNRLDAVVPISGADADDFRALGLTTPVHVVPCGVDLDEGPAAAGEPNTVGFIGSLDFLPNQDAVRWILDELWPRIPAALPEARLSIAGSAPPAWITDRAGEHVQILGNVPDAAAFVRSLRVVIAPLFAGGGMRIKVLEAMALGKAVVATAIGAGGIDVTDGHDIVLAEDAGKFADAVVRLLRDPAEAARLGAAARSSVATRYDNDSLGRGLLRFYESLIR